MQDLKSIYQDIKNKIALSREPVFIYTGVGTAAGLRNADGVLELKNYHQFPPLLQDLKNIIPSLKLFIVLIDPYQECPPYMISDSRLDVIPQVNDNPDQQNIYFDEERKITVYTLLKNVITKPFIDPLNIKTDYIDITNELRDINNFAAYKKNVTTLYHDFTGRSNELLAEYFDEEINGEDLDHIIYGLSIREDHGCYFDLTALGSYMPFKLDKTHGGQRISFFNIFKYIQTGRLDDMKKEAGQTYPLYMHAMIDAQYNSVIQSIKNEFKNNIFTTMRILLRLIRGEEKIEEIKNLYMFHYIPQPKRIYIEKQFQEGYFRELFDYLMDLFSKKMDVVVKLKEMDYTGRELIGFIINEHEQNVYNWYNNMNVLLA